MLRAAADPASIDDAEVDRSVTVKEASVLLGCDESTVRRLLDAEELDGHRVGLKRRGVRVSLSSIQRYRQRNSISGQKQNSPPADSRKKASCRQSVTAEHKEAMAFLKGLGIRFDPR